MRTPGTIVRGVFVCFIILGAVFLFNVNLAQSGTGYLPGSMSGGEPGESLAEPAADPSGGSLILAYIPMVTNRFKILENQVIVTNGQAFDKCTPPRVEDMQTWWDESPYSTINIYLGGISLACSYRETDPQWFDQVARQGWSFILTWAGPQAPPGCHTPYDFKYPMSIDPALAHLEGRFEADAAVEAAAAIGFKGNLVIYYDIEGYEDEPEECRTAVASFITGWTERLHELDVIAGAYGSPCRSYVADWAANDPPPDNVWIAHWYTNDYDPKATVWDVPCLDKEDEPPEFWSNNQRIKQYNGDHYETWGDLKIRIDSNVVDGQVNALLAYTSTQATQFNTSPGILSQTSQALKSMDLITSSEGWVLFEDRLLWTADSGTTWQEVSPPISEKTQILDAMFTDINHGWLALQDTTADQNSSVSILSTVDGGLSWQSGSLPNMNARQVMQIDSAFLDFVDEQYGWIALKLHSSSNFSFGRLFATKDGGLTWQERSLPLGEPVKFIDSYRGWTAGGPRGDQIFHTDDAGRTWQIQELPPMGSISNGEIEFGLPVFEDQDSGVLPMIHSDGEMKHTYLFSTYDAGRSWTLARIIQDTFNSVKNEGATPALAVEQEQLKSGLPDGVVALDMVNNQRGWALIQNGTCTGRKARAGESLPPGVAPLRCESYSGLMKTTDGGNSWFEITPNTTE